MAAVRSQALAVALVAAMLLAGCAGTDSPATPTADTAPPTPAASPPSDTATADAAVETTAASTLSDTATADPPPEPTTVSTPSATQPVPTTSETTVATSAAVSTTAPEPATTEPTKTVAPETTTTSSSVDSRFGGDAWEVTVTRVVDGDTLDVRFPDGEVETVRLLGVDTPEVHTEVDPSEYDGVPDTLDGRDWLRNTGAQASDYMTQYDGESVVIETDSHADRRGYYGRLLVYVYHDGTNVNRELLRRGLARVYESSFTLRGEFEGTEATAQANDVGVWEYEPPATTTQSGGGSSDGQLAVTTIHADAAGNDHTNENDEYITFTNTGSGPLDLSGWTISDAADHTYHVPNGVSLDAGDSITLYTGSGQNTATELYWGSDAAIWNNDGDTIIVTDDTGTVVLSEEY